MGLHKSLTKGSKFKGSKTLPNNFSIALRLILRKIHLMSTSLTRVISIGEKPGKSGNGT